MSVLSMSSKWAMFSRAMTLYKWHLREIDGNSDRIETSLYEAANLHNNPRHCALLHFCNADLCRDAETATGTTGCVKHEASILIFTTAIFSIQIRNFSGSWDPFIRISPQVPSAGANREGPVWVRSYIGTPSHRPGSQPPVEARSPPTCADCRRRDNAPATF